MREALRRRQGVEVLADAYPHVAYSTGLAIFLPGWALERGTKAMLERLKDAGNLGRIARGRKADIVVFDATKIKDEATFDNPHRYPTGILHVVVNGVPVVQNGSHTGARPGRMLRKA